MKNLELCDQEIEYLQGLFIDMLQSNKVISNYEEKRIKTFLDKLAKL